MAKYSRKLHSCAPSVHFPQAYGFSPNKQGTVASQAESPWPRPDQYGSVSLRDLWTVANAARMRIATLAVIGLGVAFASGLLTAAQYTVTASFTPQSHGGTNSLGGLAVQLGVPIAAPASQTPQFYADLVRTRELLRRTATARVFGDSAAPRTLAEVVQLADSNPEVVVWKSVRWLDQRVSAIASNKTGVVTVQTSAPTAKLAQQISAELLSLVNTFNLETRQSEAAAERKFAEQRMAELRTELEQEEDAFQEFLERNRAGLAAPELAFQRGRHERAVALRQQIYTSMVQAHEQARLDEVRDTPVITVIESPRAPLSPDSKHWILRLALGLAAGGAIAFVTAWMRVPAGVGTPADLAV